MKRKIISIVIFLPSLIIAWVAFSLVWNWLLNLNFFRRIWSIDLNVALGIWIISVILLFILKARLKWLVIFCSPFILLPALWFCTGSIDYFKGRAAFKLRETSENRDYLMENGNLSRKFRVWQELFRGSDEFFTYASYDKDEECYTYTSYNFAIKFWTTFLGYQKGSYRGAYPDKETANNQLEQNGEPVQLNICVDPECLFFAKFLFHKKPVTLLCSNIEVPIFIDPKSIISTKAFVLNEELIIVKINFKEKFNNRYVICLADKSNGELIAAYQGIEKSTYPVSTSF